MGLYENVPFQEIERMKKFNYPNTVSTQVLCQHANEYHQLLDVGCGPNSGLAAFCRSHGWQYTGVDKSQRIVNSLEKNLSFAHIQAKTAEGDITKGLNFADGSFSLVHARFLLMHLEHTGQWVPALHEMMRLLKPGGFLYVLEWDWDTFRYDKQGASANDLTLFLQLSQKLARMLKVDLRAGQKLPLLELCAHQHFHYSIEQRPKADYSEELSGLCEIQAAAAKQLGNATLVENFKKLKLYFIRNPIIFQPPGICIAQLQKLG